MSTRTLSPGPLSPKKATITQYSAPNPAMTQAPRPGATPTPGPPGPTTCPARSRDNNERVRRLLPDPSDPLDDDALTAQYAVPATNGRPHVRLNFISSVDGAVTVGTVSKGLQTPGDKRVYDNLRTQADAILVGAGTARTEQYGPARLTPEQVTQRRSLGFTKPPAIAVISETLALDPDTTLFTAATTRTIVITHSSAPTDHRAALAEVADVIVAGESSVDLPLALAMLAERGLTRILCEGGPQLFGALLAAGCVDELCVTTSPLLVGPGPGRMIAGIPDTTPVRLRLSHVLEEDGALFCRYIID